MHERDHFSHFLTKSYFQTCLCTPVKGQELNHVAHSQCPASLSSCLFVWGQDFGASRLIVACYWGTFLEKRGALERAADFRPHTSSVKEPAALVGWWAWSQFKGRALHHRTRRGGWRWETNGKDIVWFKSETFTLSFSLKNCIFGSKREKYFINHNIKMFINVP